MAKATEDNNEQSTGQQTDKTQQREQEFARNQGSEQPAGGDEVEQPADGGGLRQRTEQELEERRAMQEAEAFAPPAGEGALVNPDAQRRDPDGEAKPTA